MIFAACIYRQFTYDEYGNDSTYFENEFRNISVNAVTLEQIVMNQLFDNFSEELSYNCYTDVDQFYYLNTFSIDVSELI